MRTSSILRLLLACVLSLTSSLHADLFTVTNNLDDVGTPPPGSLRHAIANAVSGDTIEFSADVTGTITLAGAELLLDKNLTINGPGASVLAISGNQQSRVFRVPAGAVLTIKSLTLRDGRAPDGADATATTPPTPPEAGGAGGAIHNSGDLTLLECTVANSSAGKGGDGDNMYVGGSGGTGGAIANTSGVLTMSKCLITESTAGAGGYLKFGGKGGGLSNIGGTLNLVDCTISGNIGGPGAVGGDGGGIYCEGGSARLERCTIQQNKPGFGVGYIYGIYSALGGHGGGLQLTSNCTVEINTCTITGNICGESEADNAVFHRGFRTPTPGAGIYCVSGTVSMVSTTIYGNVGWTGLAPEPVFPTGTGLFVEGGAVTLSNTIIAGNYSGYGGHQDLAGTVTSAGHNLIGVFDNTRATGIVPGTNGDQAGTQSLRLDPLLGPLTDFGAPTSVLPLLPGSPAFEAGNDQLTGTDQRGQPRPTGAHVDIGAFEGLATVIQFGSAISSIPEHGGSVTITVIREGNLTDSFCVSYATADGSATAGNDYAPQSGTLTFGPGVTQQSITIPIIDDSIIDLGETFTVQLTSPTGHSILGSKKTQSITIEDNDNTVQFASAPMSVPEQGGSAAITVFRLGSLTDSVSVSYATADESATGGNDYTPQSGTLTFGPGVTQQTITIPIIDDSVVESDETFTIQLSSPTGHLSLGSRSSYRITVVSDDSIVQFTSATSSIPEQGGSATITVVRVGSLTDSVSVSYATADESATAGNDYVSQSGTLTFGPGVTQRTITIPIIDDSVVESDETFTIQLSSPTGHASLGSTSLHRITIVSDSPEPDPAVFTVTNTEDNPVAPPPGSLRHAIATAASGDTIEFSAAVTGTITLGGAELLIDKNLTITGPGADVLAISGNQRSPVFRVPAGKVVAISGLTIRDGKAANGANALMGGLYNFVPATPAESGGGIKNEGMLTLSSCSLTNNAAGSGGNGIGPGDPVAKNATDGGSGGAIFSSSSLSVVDCLFNGNSAGAGGFSGTGKAGDGGSGGAVYATGALHLLNCSFDQNVAGRCGGTTTGPGQQGTGGHGGCIAVVGNFSDPSIASIEGCSISRSFAGRGRGVSQTEMGYGGWGGGVYTSNATVELKSCTISGNAAGDVWPVPYVAPGPGNGGGLAFQFSSVQLACCTISDNVAGENPFVYGMPGPNPYRDGVGGGIHARESSVTLRNSIVAGNRSTIPSGTEVARYASDLSGNYVSAGHNLIGRKDGSEGFNNGVNSDIVGSLGSPVDAHLAVLANYGGSTLTHALLEGSPALEAGDDALTGVDQRGLPRLVGSHVDIGAYESELRMARISFLLADSEVNEGAGSVSVTVVQVNPSASTVSVQYTITAGSATAGSDFTAASGTLEFPPGRTEQVITIPILDNPEVEAAETFQVTLSTPSSNAIIGAISSHTVTIMDNDGPGTIEFASSETTVSESSPAISITLIRKHASDGTVSVAYMTANGSAVAGSDFTASNGVVTFGPGVTQQTISIPLLHDDAYEFDETFTVRLSDPTGGATLGEKFTHTVTIQSEDPPPVLGFSTATSTVSESDGSVVVTVVRSGSTNETVSVSYQTTSGSATSGSDFIPNSGTLTFAPTETEKTIPILIAADGVIEGVESFQLSLSNPTNGAVLGAISTHTVNILSPNGPAAISFAVAGSSVSESAGFATVTLLRSGTVNTAPTVRVNTSNGTARAGSDFSKVGQTVTFPVGATSAEIQIKIVDDRSYEADETFTLVLSDPGDGGTLASQITHSITILNDDAPAGRYRGLAERDDGPDKAGITITKTAGGNVTGSMQFRGKTLRFQARDVEAEFTQIFLPSPKNGFAGGTLLIHFGDSGSAGGTFESFNGVFFHINLKRDKIGTTREPVAEAGNYTAILNTELDGSPAGFLVANVLPSGRVALKGMLPDGARLASSSHVAEDGTFPIFIALYPKSAGYLAGRAEIALGNSVALSGELGWLKPPATGPLYPAGLDHLAMQLIGGSYNQPQHERILDDYNASAGALRFQASPTGNLAGQQTSLFWETNNRIRKTAASSIDAQVTLRPQTGLFSGTFADAEGHPRKFHGICVQQPEAGQDLAVGFYIGESTAGRIELRPED
jgi:hypothetical protein